MAPSDNGKGPHQIVDAFMADRKGIIADIRRRKAVLDRSRA
jgi:hypothetical protein